MKVHKKIKLDLGCGNRKLEGHIGVDRAKLQGVDVVCDMDHGMPFKEDCIDEINASHFLLHVKDLVKTVEEIHRIGKKGCKIRVLVPYYNSEWNFKDPTHTQSFHEETFNYFADNSTFYYYSNARFKIKKISFEHGTRIGRLIPDIFGLRLRLSHYISNITTGIIWELSVEKDN